MKQDGDRSTHLMDFKELRQRIGFDDYYAASEIYQSSQRKMD